MTVPRASYRLQLTPQFGFDDASGLLATLQRIGVSHLYLSPIAEAVEGSQHGYDVVDHTRVRQEFGGRDGLDRLLDAAAEHDLGVIIDHVPNHVSVARAELNPHWWQTLAEGPDSASAAYFDIEWDAADGKVVIPKLGNPIDEMVESGDIEIVQGADESQLHVGTLRFPLAAGTETLDLAEALQHQHYRLQWWRDPFRNVRRFFTIDDLVAVRVEDASVVDAVDTLPQQLVTHPAFAGVRVDHVDGLADPGRYLRQLRSRLGDRMLLVEKILAPNESLPTTWPVDGTTGYEHITVAEHMMLDPDAREPLMRLWMTSAGDVSFHDLDRAARIEVLDGGLGPDLDRLVRVVSEAAPSDAAASLTRSVIVLLTLELERYRTYLPDDESWPVFHALVESAEQRGGSDAKRTEIRRVAGVLAGEGEARTRWQQLTGPVMAKGAEDRAFYRYFPLASLSEVGGTPGDFTTSVPTFHRHQLERSDTSPTAMLASTTHDTKRSAGVRARSLALAAAAQEWERHVSAWVDAHADALGSIDRRFVALAVQTAVTARPLSVDRLHDYLVKAAREGDEITSWRNPDVDAESALRRVSELAVDAAERGGLAGFADRIEPVGDAIGLRLLALQLTCPGFADLYQGTPMTLLSLVDPDNRIPPTWTALTQLVDEVATADTESAFADGRIDLARMILTERVLRLRRRRVAAFGAQAGYCPLAVDGVDADNVIAYARTQPIDEVGSKQEPTVVVMVTRARSKAVDGAGTRLDLPHGTWRSIMHDDARIVEGGWTRVGDVLSTAEVAILERTDR